MVYAVVSMLTEKHVPALQLNVIILSKCVKPRASNETPSFKARCSSAKLYLAIAVCNLLGCFHRYAAHNFQSGRGEACFERQAGLCRRWSSFDICADIPVVCLSSRQPTKTRSDARSTSTLLTQLALSEPDIDVCLQFGSGRNIRTKQPNCKNNLAWWLPFAGPEMWLGKEKCGVLSPCK